MTVETWIAHVLHLKLFFHIRCCHIKQAPQQAVSPSCRDKEGTVEALSWKRPKAEEPVFSSRRSAEVCVLHWQELAAAASASDEDRRPLHGLQSASLAGQHGTCLHSRRSKHRDDPPTLAARLQLEALLQRLRSCGARADDAEYISELFAAWAAPGVVLVLCS